PVQTSVKPRTSTARSHTLTGAGAAPHHMAKRLDRSNSFTCSWFNNGTSMEGTHKRSFALNFSTICNADNGVNLDAEITDPPTNDMANKPYVGEEAPKDIENWEQDPDVLDTWFSSA